MNSDIQGIAKFFKALANQDRLEIAKLLKDKGEMYAQDVEKRFYLEQSTTSHHLNILRRAGVTKARKVGRKVYYSLDYKSIKSMIQGFDSLFFD